MQPITLTRVLTRVFIRHRRTCYTVLIVFFTIIIIFSWNKNQHKPETGVLEAGPARKSWGLADEVKVFVEEAEAKKLASRIRVLCLVLTMKKDQETQALAVNQTWGRRCTKLIFITHQPLGDLPHVIVNVTSGRHHLTAKTIAMFKYAYEKHANEYDWFLKADDDAYVVMENLRYLLSFHDPTKNIYLGHHFKRYVDQGYMSGGAGYVISRQALKTYGEKSYLCMDDGWEEDIDFGKCMANIGIPPYESKDVLGRNSFHPPYFSDDLYWMGYVEQHAAQVKGPIHVGPSCCSQLSISFHKVSPELMYLYEFMLYRMAVFGRHTPDKLFTEFFQSKPIPKGIYTEDPVLHFV